MDKDYLVEINAKLKKYFPQEKIVFGGSFVTGKEKSYSDFDIYVIFTGFYEFYQATRRKKKLKKIKQELDQKVNLHLMSKMMLRAGLYQVEGVFLLEPMEAKTERARQKMSAKKILPTSGSKLVEKKFFNAGDADLIRLNSLKLCFKHLILYKLQEGKGSLAEKHFYNLQKNFKFLTDRDEHDLDQIENDLELEVKKVKIFIFKDWFFYCLRFRKIMPKDFEQRIIDCLLNLKRFTNTNSGDYLKKFYQDFKHLADKVKISDNPKEMFSLINRYVFLIFII